MISPTPTQELAIVGVLLFVALTLLLYLIARRLASIERKLDRIVDILIGIQQQNAEHIRASGVDRNRILDMQRQLREIKWFFGIDQLEFHIPDDFEDELPPIEEFP